MASMTINWRIEQFSFRSRSSTPMDSPGIPSAALGLSESQGEWQLAVTPRVLSKRDHEPKEREFMGLHLKRDTIRGSEFPTRFYLRIMNNSGQCIYQRDSTKPVLFSSKGEGTVMWGWDRYIAHDDLFSPAKGLLTADDTLILQAEFHSLIGSRSVRERNIVFPPECLPTCGLKTDYSRLFRDRTGADFVVVAKDGVRCLAHSHVLIARSLYFRAMLTHSMLESSERRCKLDDLNGTCVDALMEYLYCGTCSEAKLDKYGETLLIAADKYLIRGLKQYCEQFLLTSATIHNAARLLVLADMYSAKELELGIKQFIVPRFGAFIAADGIRVLDEYPGRELATELVQFVTDNLSNPVQKDSSGKKRM